MIQTQTTLKVFDNSGAKIVKCIKVLGGFKKKIAKLGETIIVSIQKLRKNSQKNSKIKKGDIHKALIIRTKNVHNHKDGSQIKFNENAVVLIDKQNMPLSTRIIGPIPQLLKKKKTKK